MKNEIGGYLELETYHGEQYHKDAIKLNCGRGCIKYLVELRNIKKVWLPDYMCDSVYSAFKKMQCEIKVYAVNSLFLPSYDFEVKDDEWLFLNDYYGQLKKEDICKAKNIFGGRVVCDETQGFFKQSTYGVDTFYSCRKWFGVSDGAYLITSDGKRISRDLSKDESRERMIYLLGRYETNATEYFGRAKQNNLYFDKEPAKEMSTITENLLRSIDYEYIKEIRIKNWDLLNEKLRNLNELELVRPYVPFMYPLLIKNSRHIKERLAEKSIYIPTLWPNVISEHSSGSVAYRYADGILPLPIDQRYREEHMERMINEILNLLGNGE